LENGGAIDVPGAPSFSTESDKTTETGLADLVIAVGFLGAAVVLDRRRRAGVATPFVAVGAFYAIVAAVVLADDVGEVALAGVFVAVAALAIGLVGSLGERRGTSWVGAFTLLVGTLVIVVKITIDTVSGSGGAAIYGGYALAAAAVLLAIGIVIARRCGEPIDGDEPTVPDVTETDDDGPAAVETPALES
jgi:hypothetical protein